MNRTVVPHGGKKDVLYGNDAIKKVMSMEGELTYAQRRVIEEEGFVNGLYEDSKGIITYGVGQTGEWINKTFKESFEVHKKDAAGLLSDFDNYPEYLQAELIQAAYRGDLQGSPTFRKHMNAGRYQEAAIEFLNNNEYKELLPKRDTNGIPARMERVQNAVFRFAKEYSDREQRFNNLMKR